ncbi:MAG TPA: 50S ribosomal protein L17 [Candidatus Paceibacterota bacterium]
MRHHNANKKFGRETGQRAALMRSLVRSLFLKGSITTTEARAKAIRPIAEKLVTRGKTGSLADRRIIISRMAGDTRAAGKVETIATKFKERAGGYLRIVKMGPRKGDGASMANISFVGDEK